MWDGPVSIPALHERLSYNKDHWDQVPWMSLTPMEMMTMRHGTKRARGRVIVAGLGLGHQLIEVSKRKQVKEIVLVEKSQELVDWILPRTNASADMCIAPSNFPVVTRTTPFSKIVISNSFFITHLPSFKCMVFFSAFSVLLSTRIPKRFAPSVMVFCA